MIERYTLPEMLAIWDEETKFKNWMKVEMAVLKTLEEEKRLLGSAERRSQRAGESYDLLYEKEGAALTILDQVSQRIRDLSEMDESFSETAQNMGTQ